MNRDTKMFDYKTPSQILLWIAPQWGMFGKDRHRQIAYRIGSCTQPRTMYQRNICGLGILNKNHDQLSLDRLFVV